MTNYGLVMYNSKNDGFHFISERGRILKSGYVEFLKGLGLSDVHPFALLQWEDDSKNIFVAEDFAKLVDSGVVSYLNDNRFLLDRNRGVYIATVLTKDGFTEMGVVQRYDGYYLYLIKGTSTVRLKVSNHEECETLESLLEEKDRVDGYLTYLSWSKQEINSEDEENMHPLNGLWEALSQFPPKYITRLLHPYKNLYVAEIDGITYAYNTETKKVIPIYKYEEDLLLSLTILSPIKSNIHKLYIRTLKDNGIGYCGDTKNLVARAGQYCFYVIMNEIFAVCDFKSCVNSEELVTALQNRDLGVSELSRGSRAVLQSKPLFRDWVSKDRDVWYYMYGYEDALED